jgi:hypothetical protein
MHEPEVKTTGTSLQGPKRGHADRELDGTSAVPVAQFFAFWWRVFVDILPP